MDNPTEEKLAPETKPEAPRHAAEPMNKFEAKRRANKQRKTRAHHRKLRRSNTKG
jgi:hypothetical protein